MDAGVRLADPARFDLRGALHCGVDVEIDIGCLFEGEVTLGDGVRIGAHCLLRDTQVAAGVRIEAFSHLEGARVGVASRIGPYARLRPGAELGQDVHIGNFVEVKNSTLGDGAKANHLAYLGDASVGARVNFGAGSITANYDGANKHRTVIGDDVHVGSQLRAGGADRDRCRGHDRRRIDPVQGCAGWPAERGQGAAVDSGGLAAPQEEGRLSRADHPPR